MWLRCCVLFLCVGLLSGCNESHEKTVYKTTDYVFGTLVDITIIGVSEEKAKAATAGLSAGFRRMHNDWHGWKPGGELMAINAACLTGKTLTVSDFVLPVLQQAKTFYAESDGLFNPAIGKIIGAWGFHSDDLPIGYKPPFDKIRALTAAHPSMDDIRIDGHKVTCVNPAVSLDFGGFGKGAALDWALAQLKAKGIKNAVINAGGDVSTMGSHGDRPWRIGIRHPKTWGVLASVDAAPDEAVYTSGNYERYREEDGIRYSHIIDPRTGKSVRDIVSSTVIHKNGALADAAATALSVAGAKDWPEIAAKMGVDTVLLVDENGVLYASPAMAKRLILEGNPKPSLVVLKPQAK